MQNGTSPGEDPTARFRSNTLPTPLKNQWRWSSASAILEAPPPTRGSPVTFRILSSGARRKQAQNIRNSVAITSSDYYNSRRPQLALLQLPTGYRAQSVQALDTISEYEACDSFESELDGQKGPLFQYTPNSVRDPSRQEVPRPLSRASSINSLPGSNPPTSPDMPLPTSPPSRPSPLTTNALKMPTIQVRAEIETLSRAQTPTGRPLPLGGIPFTESTEGQFETLHLNRQSGRLYMLDTSGFYTPLSEKQMNALKCNQPPAADRRPSFRTNPQPAGKPILPEPSTPKEPPLRPACDSIHLSYIVMVLLLICLNIPATLIFSIPTIFYSKKARKATSEGRSEDARIYSQFVIYLNASALLFHVFTVLAVIAVIFCIIFI